MSDAVICSMYKGSDPRKENQMGGAYGTYGGQENCIRGLGWGHLREKAQLEDLGVDEKIILNRYSRSGMEWYGLD